MYIPVLVETVPGDGYRASSGQPLSITVEAATCDEALQKLRQAIEGRLETGARIVPLEIPMLEHPLAPFAGMHKDDPLFEEWQQTIAELRRQAEADPNFP